MQLSQGAEVKGLVFSSWVRLAVGLLAPLAVACEPKVPDGTGGTDVPEVFGQDGRSCGRGLTVSMTDYESSNVALVGLDGTILSPSFISSASTETKLSAPLIEAVFPASRMQEEVVVIDRFPASVLTFVDPASAEVRTQLSVRTGFDANPQDYLDLGDGRALVSRFELNPDPGREAFDGGDDLVWIDVEEGAVVGRIDLSSVADPVTGRARPSQILRAGDTLLVTMTGHDSTFQDAAPGRILALDATDGSILGTHEIEGTKNCVGMALSPEENELAVSCSDLIDAANDAAPAQSALVVVQFSRAGDEVTWEETFRLPASELGWGPFSPSVSFAADDLVLAGFYGSLEGPDQGRPDRVVSVDLSTGDATELLASQGMPFTLGDVRCVEPCGVCFVADAGRNVLHRFPVDEGQLGAPTTHVVETEIGLPPRGLGQF